MSTKEQKIKEAYGEHWENFNDSAKQCALKHDGFISSILEHRLTDIETEYSDSKRAWRPKSLSGIENNNGWIRIESEADLIVEEGYYAVFNTRFKGNEISIIQIVIPYKLDSYITHYQPIIKPEKPIY